MAKRRYVDRAPKGRHKHPVASASQADAARLCLRIALVDGPCPSIARLFTDDQLQNELARKNKCLSIFAKQSHIGNRTSLLLDPEAAKQVAQTSEWSAARIDVRKAVASEQTEVSDIRRRGFEQCEELLFEAQNMTEEQKDALIVKADQLGKPLIDAFIEETEFWPELELRADTLAGRYCETDLLLGSTHGLSKRVVRFVKRVFKKKAPVRHKAIPMACLLDVAAYVSEDRLARHDADRGQGAGGGQGAGAALAHVDFEAIVAAGIEKALAARDLSTLVAAAQAKADKIIADAEAEAEEIRAKAVASASSAAQQQQQLAGRRTEPIMSNDELASFPAVPKKRRSWAPETPAPVHVPAPVPVRDPMEIFKKGDHVLMPRKPHYPEPIGSDKCVVEHYRGILCNEAIITTGEHVGEYGWTIEWFPIFITAGASIEPVHDPDHSLTVGILKPFLKAPISAQAYHIEILARHARNLEMGCELDEPVIEKKDKKKKQTGASRKKI